MYYNVLMDLLIGSYETLWSKVCYVISTINLMESLPNERKGKNSKIMQKREQIYYFEKDK